MFPSFPILFQCYLRTYFVGAAFNTRGMQNVGLMYILDPALQAIHQEEKKLKLARKRYIKHYNTHPFWTPFLVGFFLYLELKIAKGILPEESFKNIKKTSIYTLSAIGDSFFGGALLVFWSLTTVLFLLHGFHTLAFVLTACWVLSLQLFKLFLLFQGLNNGLLFFQRLKTWDLINWGQRVKALNAILISVLWVSMYPFQDPIYWFPMTGGICFVAWISTKLFWARECAMILLAIISVSLYFLM